MQKGEEKTRFISGKVLLQTDQDFRKTLEPTGASRPVLRVTAAGNTRGSFILISPLLYLHVQDLIVLGIYSHPSSLPAAAVALLLLV